MANSNPSSGCKDDQENELCVCDAPEHGDKYPYLQEFSDFLASLSTKSLFYLSTHRQRNLAKAFWEAENYGGSREKCRSHLKEIYGADWPKLTRLEDHFTEERKYLEYVLTLEHMQQWDKYRKTAKLQANKTTST